MDLVRDLRKYAHYVFDIRSFTSGFDGEGISEHAFQAAKAIRGLGRSPVIILHGIMKRSGTGYVGHLLWLHPDLCQYPNEIWETPFLSLAGDIRKMQAKFFFTYEQNVGKVGRNDFLPMFGSSLIAYLYSWVPQGQQMLLKTPDVQYLDHFFSVFPYEHLLVLVRDGRDVVSSTIKAWPQIRFADACRRWNRSAKMILRCHERYAGREGYWLVKYEDVIRDPTSFVKEVCRRFDLEESRYPYEKIDSIPIHGSSYLKKKDGILTGWVQKPKGFKPVGRWREWGPWKKWVFKRIAGQALVDLGYCEDLNW